MSFASYTTNSVTSSKNVIAVWTAFCAIGPVADNDPNLEDPRHVIPKCLAEANEDYLDQAVDHLCSTCSIFKGRQRSLAATVNARRIGSRKEERRRQLVVARAAIAGTETAYIFFLLFFFLFFSFISLTADGPHHYHPACGHKGSSHLSPVHASHFFYRDASSALLQLVNQWLNFTYSRSHAFRYERKNTNPTLVRIELTTSVLADVQLTY